jgi:hypothetical protein
VVITHHYLTRGTFVYQNYFTEFIGISLIAKIVRFRSFGTLGTSDINTFTVGADTTPLDYRVYLLEPNFFDLVKFRLSRF